jgi:hypothetical protein
LDLRTGKPCDYGKLAHEVERRMRRDHLKWRPAADAVASEANNDHAEAIVRTLNRRACKGATERPSPAAASPLPLLGAGLLYEHIKEVLVRIRREVTGKLMPDDFFEVRAKTADLIRSWLERSAEGSRLPPGASLWCGEVRPSPFREGPYSRSGRREPPTHS